MPQVNEKSTAYLTIGFLDKAGALQTPASIVYRIDDELTRTQIRGDTTLTPTATVEITLTPADNAVRSASLAVERHIVTVIGAYGADDQVTAQFVYEVLNLQAVV
jgi:hypothetical protein